MEMFVLAKIGQHIGWWLAVWLVMSALTGLALIKEARFNMVRELAWYSAAAALTSPHC